MRNHLFASVLSVVGICVGFLSMSLVCVTYMAKDYNAYNSVYAFFHITSDIRMFLTAQPISKTMLLRLLNLSYILFIFSSVVYSMLFAELFSVRLRCKLELALLAPMLAQAVLLDPHVVVRLYMQSVGPFENIFFFRSLYETLPTVLRWLDISLIALSIVLLIVSYFHTPKSLRTGTGLVTLLFCGLSVVTLLLFSWMPVQVLWMSRVAGYIGFDSLPVYKPTTLNAYLPFVSMLFVVFLCAATWFYLHKRSSSRHAELLFRSKVSAVDTVSRVFCHYLKNELLSQQAELRLLMAKVQPELQPDVDYIIRKNDEIYQRLSTVRDTMKQKKITLVGIDLSDVLRGAVSEIDLPNDVHAVTLLPSVPVWVQGNAYQLREVINCLVRNALEASSTNGASRKLKITLESMRHYVIVSVANNGPRIPREEWSSIFDPFVSTKPSKSNWGLGLALCKNIVTLHHGRIWLDEHVEDGATLTMFHFMLPLSK